MTPIGDAESAQRVRADAVLKHILRPALVPSIVSAVTRVDLEPRSGFITSTVIEKIIKSRIVVADITGLNPNVFYELAIAHAARVPVITIREPEATIPFDISALNAIECGLDIAGGTAAIHSIKTAAERLLEDPSQVESPVKTALLLLNVDKSGSGQKSLEAEVLRRLDRLEGVIGRYLDATPSPSELSRLRGMLSHSPEFDPMDIAYEINLLNNKMIELGNSGGSKREIDALNARRDMLLHTYERNLLRDIPDLPGLQSGRPPPGTTQLRGGQV